MSVHVGGLDVESSDDDESLLDSSFTMTGEGYDDSEDADADSVFGAPQVPAQSRIKRIVGSMRTGKGYARLRENSGGSSVRAAAEARRKAEERRLIAEAETDCWTKPFSVEAVGDFEMGWPDGSASKPLMTVIRQRGPTRALVFRSAWEAGNQTVLAGSMSRSLSLRAAVQLPMFDLDLVADGRPLFYMSVAHANVEYARFHDGHEHVFATVRDIQIDNMGQAVEFPVLLSADKSKQFDRSVNLVEVLFEISLHEQIRFIKYIGVRVLPINVRIDRDVLDFVALMREQFMPVDDGTGESDASSVRRRNKSKGAVPEAEETEKGKIFVETVSIFPIEIHLSLGHNALGIPVIREGAPVSLGHFARFNLYGSPEEIVEVVARSYARVGLTEIIKVVLGSSDTFGAPLAAVRKVKQGMRDFVEMPFIALVHEDSIGATTLGLVNGTTSLVVNTADAVVMALVMLSSSASRALLFLTFDSDYQRAAVEMRRRQPRSAVNGVVMGGRMLREGLKSGARGLWYQPVRSVRLGARPVLSGAWGVAKGTGGLPLKWAAGGADFASKALEGVKQTFADELHVQVRLQHGDMAATSEEQDELLASLVKSHLAGLDEVEVMRQDAKLRSRNRTRSILFVMTQRNIRLFNPASVRVPEDCELCAIALDNISEVIVPRESATDLMLGLRSVVTRMTFIHLVLSDRAAVLDHLRLEDGLAIVPFAARETVEAKRERYMRK